MKKVITLVLQDRPDYAKVILDALGKCDGIGGYLILAHIEPGNEEMLSLAKSINFAKVQITLNKEKLGMARNICQAWEHGFQKADFIVHLDDRTVPARDCLRYMEHCAEVYRDDPKIFSVSGYTRSSCKPFQCHMISRRNPFTGRMVGLWKNRWEWIKDRWSDDPDLYAVHLNNELAKFDLKEIYPLLSRAQKIEVENDAGASSEEIHRPNQHLDNWAGDRELRPGNYCETGLRLMGSEQRIINTQKPSVGLVIGTFAALPYIHLQLESRKRNYPDLPVLVHDDGSPIKAPLKDLCQHYGVDFVTSKKRLRHSIGDLAAFAAGFSWAGEKKLDLLVKFSRRFIPLYNWVIELQELAFMTQYATYSSRCAHYGLGFRTECVAMHIPSWLANQVVDEIIETVRLNQGSFVEKFIHDLARKVHKDNCKQNRDYEKFGGKPKQIAAYGDWLLSGMSRHIPRPNVLWHNYMKPKDYAKAACKYGLNYTAMDFADPNSGYGLGPAR